MSINYTSKYNPTHSRLKIQDGVMNKDTVHANSLSYIYYGEFSPTPLGSVHVSDDLPIMDYILHHSKDALELFYAARKVGNFSLAAEFALQISEPESRKLARSISLFLDNRAPEAREMISLVRKSQTSAVQLWKAIILGDFDCSLYDGPLDLLIRNPLLYHENVRRNLHPELISKEHLFLDGVVDSERFALVFFVYLQNHCSLIPDNDIPLVSSFVKSNSELVSTNLNILKAISQRVGTRVLMAFLSNCKGFIPFTSELINLLISRDSLLLKSVGGFAFDTNNSVVFQRGGGLDYSLISTRDSVVEDILSHRYTLKDRNTSDYGNRFYTSDLCYSNSPLAWMGEQLAEIMYGQYVPKVSALLGAAGFDLEVPVERGCWFDASFTHGQSKIDPHFHTAGKGRSYLATAVLYLETPSRQSGDGSIYFENDLEMIFEPVSGDLAFFPPWLVHGTTALKTDRLRITLNFDLVSPTIFFQIRGR